jgi:hypothetical protein
VWTIFENGKLVRVDLQEPNDSDLLWNNQQARAATLTLSPLYRAKGEKK